MKIPEHINQKIPNARWLEEYQTSPIWLSQQPVLLLRLISLVHRVFLHTSALFYPVITTTRLSRIFGGQTKITRLRVQKFQF